MRGDSSTLLGRRCPRPYFFAFAFGFALAFAFGFALALPLAFGFAFFFAPLLWKPLLKIHSFFFGSKSCLTASP